MRPQVKTAVLFWLFFIMMVSAARAQETVQAVFDGRQWNLGSENYNEEKKAMMKTYVPEGTTFENWSELITLQFFEGMQEKIKIEEFLRKVQTGMKSACPDVDWATVSEKENEAVYSWSIKGCQGQPDQTEITRVVAGRDGMHIWHYAVKDPDLKVEKIKEWIDRLGEFRLKD